MAEERKLKRGAFILLEGLDRSGKTTQASMLVERLQQLGHAAVLMRFPDRTTEIGKMLDMYLRSAIEVNDHTVHLLFCANRWEKEKEMRKHLLAGTTLVVDRYSFSGASFSAAKGLDLSWCMDPEVGLPAPDVVLFMDIPEAEAEKHGGYGRERYESKDIQRKVKSNYQKLNPKQQPWKIIQAGARTKEVIHKELTDLAIQTIESVLSKPIENIENHVIKNYPINS